MQNRVLKKKKHRILCYRNIGPKRCPSYSRWTESTSYTSCFFFLTCACATYASLTLIPLIPSVKYFLVECMTHHPPRNLASWVTCFSDCLSKIATSYLACGCLFMLRTSGKPTTKIHKKKKINIQKYGPPPIRCAQPAAAAAYRPEA